MGQKLAKMSDDDICEEPLDNCYYESSIVTEKQINSIKCTICGYCYGHCRDNYDFLILYRVFRPFFDKKGPAFYACATHSRKKYDDDGNMVEDSLLDQCLFECPCEDRGHYGNFHYRHLTDMGKTALFPLVKIKKATVQ